MGENIAEEDNDPLEYIFDEFADDNPLDTFGRSIDASSNNLPTPESLPRNSNFGFEGSGLNNFEYSPAHMNSTFDTGRGQSAFRYPGEGFYYSHGGDHMSMDQHHSAVRFDDAEHLLHSSEYNGMSLTAHPIHASRSMVNFNELPSSLNYQQVDQQQGFMAYQMPQAENINYGGHYNPELNQMNMNQMNTQTNLQASHRMVQLNMSANMNMAVPMPNDFRFDNIAEEFEHEQSYMAASELEMQHGDIGPFGYPLAQPQQIYPNPVEIINEDAKISVVKRMKQKQTMSFAHSLPTHSPSIFKQQAKAKRSETSEASKISNVTLADKETALEPLPPSLFAQTGAVPSQKPKKSKGRRRSSALVGYTAKVKEELEALDAGLANARTPEEELEMKRQRRLARNRESARQSRRRKKQQLETVEQHVIDLSIRLELERREFLSNYFTKKRAEKLAFLKNLLKIASTNNANNRVLEAKVGEYERSFGLADHYDLEVFQYHFAHAMDLLFPAYMRYFLFVLNKSAHELSSNPGVLNRPLTTTSGQTQGQAVQNGLPTIGIVPKTEADVAHSEGGSSSSMSPVTEIDVNVWDNFCRELNLTAAQKEKLKTDLKNQYSQSASNEQTKLAFVASYFSKLKECFEIQTVALEAQLRAVTGSLMSSANPTQVINFLIYFEETVMKQMPPTATEAEQKQKDEANLTEFKKMVSEAGLAADLNSVETEAISILEKKDEDLSIEDLQVLLSLLSMS